MNVFRVVQDNKVPMERPVSTVQLDNSLLREEHVKIVLQEHTHHVQERRNVFHVDVERNPIRVQPVVVYVLPESSLKKVLNVNRVQRINSPQTLANVLVLHVDQDMK